jgi:hypothetical protein
VSLPRCGDKRYGNWDVSDIVRPCTTARYKLAERTRERRARRKPEQEDDSHSGSKRHQDPAEQRKCVS